jgi:putative ABC transport system permease protein
MAIGLGVLLINFIPQVKTTLTTEFESPNKSKVPSFFLFDIQSDQMQPLESFLEKKDIPINIAAPMIRAKLISVNDIAFEKGKSSNEAMTREEERERRMRNRGFNLSFRGELLNGEEILKGRFFKGTWDEASSKLPEISIVESFAKRLDIKMNDKLKFLIQGLEIEGVVTSFRKVKWNTFNPNFFILFQPGVLEFAPKTHLATIKVNKQSRNMVQNEIVNTFPNVSIIDVTRLIEKIAYYIDQMGDALRWMAALCILCGLFVIFSISYFQSNKNINQIGLYKALGANNQTIRSSFSLQTLLVTIIASLFGILLSFLLNFCFAYFIFDSIPQFEWETPLVTLVILIILTQAISFFTLRKLFKISPRTLINS